MWISFTPAWAMPGFAYHAHRLESGELLRAALFMAPEGKPFQPPTLTVDVLGAGESVSAHAFGIVRAPAEQLRAPTDVECLMARELLPRAFVWALVLKQIGTDTAPCRYFQAVGVEAAVVVQPRPNLSLKS